MKAEAANCKFCLKCGLKYPYDAANYCGHCGGEIVKEKEHFIYSECQICRKPIYIPEGANMHLCDYHWEIYDANEGWN